METKSKHKNITEDFRDIRGEIKKSGVNIRHFSAGLNQPYSTVRLALAGYPRTERAAMIRNAARIAARDSRNCRAKLCKIAERIFAK